MLFGNRSLEIFTVIWKWVVKQPQWVTRVAFSKQKSELAQGEVSLVPLREDKPLTQFELLTAENFQSGNKVP